MPDKWRIDIESLPGLITGLLIGGFAFGILYVIMLLATFNLAGGETLRQLEKQRIGILIVIIFFSILIYICTVPISKYRNRFTSYGIRLVSVISILLGIIGCQVSQYSSFDKAVWLQSAPKPFDMSATLLNSNKLKGKTRQEVKLLLGDGLHESGNRDDEKGTILYAVDEGWTLTLYFTCDRVVDAELRSPWLGF